jgi:hypothetical protein
MRLPAVPFHRSTRRLMDGKQILISKETKADRIDFLVTLNFVT